MAKQATARQATARQATARQPRVGRPAGRAAITPAEAARLDRNAEELGVPVAQLMESAGRALADHVASVLQRRKAAPSQAARALFVCGKGHNGGDGLCAAFHLRQMGIAADVVLAEPPERLAPLPKAWLDRLPEGSWTVWSGRPGPTWHAALIVDCLLGTGAAGRLRPPYARIVSAINARRGTAHVVSGDVPSGLGGAQAVRPHATVTFHAAKVGMTRANSGAVRVVDIGIPPGAADVGLGDLVAGYRIPRWDSHKGDNGVVGVVAGSRDLPGAAHYCAMAAYRAGADLVHVFTTAQAAATLRAYGPHALVHEVCAGPILLPSAVPDIARRLPRLGALLVGPGLGTEPATRKACAHLLAAAAQARVPVVVDADGLDAVTPAWLRRHGARTVLTPHSREFRDLAGAKATPASVAAYSRKHGTTVLWKHAGSTIAGPGGATRRCTRGHPTLTVGGTGDVLAGATAALLAKGAEPFDAACAAAYAVGCAGELAAAERTYGALPTDVIEAIPGVLLRLGAHPGRPLGTP